MSTIIKKYINVLMLTLVSMALVLIVNRILLTGYQSLLAKDMEIQIVATSEKQEEALANNVRLSKILVNGKKKDLSKIELSEGWNYMKTDDFLYAYNLPDKATLSFNYTDVTTIEFTFVSEVGSGVAEIYIDGKLMDRLNLYSDNQWELASVHFDTSMLVHPEEHREVYAVLFGFFAIVYMFLLFVKDGALAEKITKGGKFLFWCLALALLAFIDVCLVQYQNVENIKEYLSNGYLNVMVGYTLILILFMVITAISRRLWLSYGITSLVLEIAAIVSNIKINAKGSPLLPWDIQMAKEAFSVVGNYSLSISAISIVVVITSILVTLALYANRNDKSERVKLWISLPAAAGLVVLLIVYVNTTIFSGVWSINSDDRVYQVSQYYDRKGFPVAFTEYISYLLPQQAPESYSKDSMKEIAEGIIKEADKDNANDNNKPNIIVIMSESFWDVGRLENVEFEEEPLPVFNELKKESIHGNVLSHVFGGNTVVSEFECLTGFDGSFFPQDYMVYGGYMKNDFDSVVSFLESQDYHTVAMHPYLSTNYNRNVAYERFGFNETVFEDAFDENSERIRSYISDQAMYDKIAEDFEEHQSNSEQPYFMFAITMQNHGGYWGSSLNKATEIGFSAEGYDKTTIDCMNDYFAGLHSSDEALGNLIDYFRNVEEETIIVYFGDHMSDAGSNEEKMLSKESWYDPATLGYETQAHLCPFLIWSNKSSESEDKGIMEINELLPTAFEANDVSMPYFWEYLLAMQDQYAAANKVVYVEKDFSVKAVSEMNEEQAKAREISELLQYDYIWGNQYSKDLWELPDSK